VALILLGFSGSPEYLGESNALGTLNDMQEMAGNEITGKYQVKKWK
jgi:hypothetical protein